jgi:hypothetical protein
MVRVSGHKPGCKENADWARPIPWKGGLKDIPTSAHTFRAGPPLACDGYGLSNLPRTGNPEEGYALYALAMGWRGVSRKCSKHCFLDEYFKRCFTSNVRQEITVVQL